MRDVVCFDGGVRACGVEWVGGIKGHLLNWLIVFSCLINYILYNSRC